MPILNVIAVGEGATARRASAVKLGLAARVQGHVADLTSLEFTQEFAGRRIVGQGDPSDQPNGGQKGREAQAHWNGRHA